MILQALKAYYDRLAADPEIEISPIGFSRQKISFCVVLNDDGTLHEIIPVDDSDAKKPRPKLLIVPGGAKPSGSGINPCLLWDNTGYMLGFKPDDDKPERSLETFQAFRDRHLELQEAIDDPEFAAVCKFLTTWDPASAKEHQALAEITSGFGVFRIRRQTHYVHERESVRTWWESQQAIADENQIIGQCLLTGEIAPLARLHEPKIKGVSGAQSAGASIVSFNDSAYESFGRSQSYNAPVSEVAAFQYGTALNHLLRSEGGKRIQIGDATTVFWTESPSPAEELFGFIADPGSVSAEDETQKDVIRTLLQNIAQGKSSAELGMGDAETPFYVLGLSPNAARISIRFWYRNSLGDLVEAIRQHFEDIKVCRADFEIEFPPFWMLLRQTGRESKDIPPLLCGALVRSVLTKTAYPSSLLAAVVRRIQADRDVTAVRSGMIKGWLKRDPSSNTVPTVELDESNTESPYLLGRLFAVLESCQIQARPLKEKSRNENTIRESYFIAAIASPLHVFARLLHLNKHHLSAVRRRNDINEKRRDGLHRSLELKLITIIQQIRSFSHQHDLPDRAWFILGYHHQRHVQILGQSEKSKQQNEEGKTMVELRGPDESNECDVYHVGRLLAVCQQIQDLADPKVGRTYCDSYFGSASNDPRILLRVWKLARHRLRQIDDWRARRELEDLANRIVVRFEHSWPASSGVDDQASFQLGYFHQRACLPSQGSEVRYRSNDGRCSAKSLGEKRVADTLFELSVAYEYERKVVVPDESTETGQRPLRPDFSLDSADGKHTLFIEYCGLIGNDHYDRLWAKKAALYRKLPASIIADIEPGDDRPSVSLLRLAPTDVRDNARITNLIQNAITMALGEAKPHPDNPF